MRSFYVLCDDPNNSDLQWIEDQELGDSDLAALWQGKTIPLESLEGIRLLANDNPPTDLLPNPVGFLIASPNLVRILMREVAPHELQVVDAPVFSASSGLRITGYHLINTLQSIPAMTPACAAGSKIVDNLQIDITKIGSEVNIFQLAELPGFTLIADNVLKQLVGNNLKGLLAIPINSSGQ